MSYKNIRVKENLKTVGTIGFISGAVSVNSLFMVYGAIRELFKLSSSLKVGFLVSFIWLIIFVTVVYDYEVYEFIKKKLREYS